jgi:hypothetical protein
MKPKAKINPTISKPATKATASALPVTPSLIKTLSAKHPDHRDDLVLAAHCIGLAITSCPDGHPLLKDDGIFPDGVTEWLMENAEDLPKTAWMKVADSLRLFFKLLLEAHPGDYGFSLAILTLSRPNLYYIQLGYMEEERILDILDLHSKPELMAAVGLSDECIDFHTSQREEISH